LKDNIKCVQHFGGMLIILFKAVSRKTKKKRNCNMKMDLMGVGCDDVAELNCYHCHCLYQYDRWFPCPYL